MTTIIVVFQWKNAFLRVQHEQIFSSVIIFVSNLTLLIKTNSRNLLIREHCSKRMKTNKKTQISNFREEVASDASLYLEQPYGSD